MRKRRIIGRRVAAGLVGVLLAGARGAGAEEPRAGMEAETRAAAEVSLRRGLDWLKTMQRENGSWSNENFPAMTALALWGFTRSDHPDRDAICARAAAFIEQFAQPDGGIYKPATGGRGSGGLSTYNTGICMIALATYDRQKYDPIIRRARRFLAASQFREGSSGAGGFGYEQPRPSGESGGRPMRPDLSNTSWALQAMRMTELPADVRPADDADIDWKSARTFVESLQCREPTDTHNYGGFGYEPRGERGGTTVSPEGAVMLRSYGSMTYAGLESLIYAEVDRSDPRIQSALEWAARHWSVDENPGMGLKGLFYYYTILSKSLRLAGVDELRAPDGRVIAWKRELAAKLAELQRPDGSWVNSDNQFWEGDPVLATSYAVLSLESVLGR